MYGSSQNSGPVLSSSELRNVTDLTDITVKKKHLGPIWGENAFHGARLDLQGFVQLENIARIANAVQCHF